MTQHNRRTVAKVARQLVVELIDWEMLAADGDHMNAACEEFGPDRVMAALDAIRDDLTRKGVAPVEVNG